MLGGSSFTSVVRDKREALMKTIAAQVNEEAKPFGVEIVDVRIKRVDLPEANMQAIYRRMQTERQREAAEFRAEGEGASRRIRATADREVTVIKADATGESERIRGNGDAEKNRIFAEAFGQDPDFFSFYRSMQAYEGAFKSGDTKLLLTPDSQFFRYFNNSFGKTGADGTGAPAAQPANPSEPPKAPADDGGPIRSSKAPPGRGPCRPCRAISPPAAASFQRRRPLRLEVNAAARRCRNEHPCRRSRAGSRHRRHVMGACAWSRPQVPGGDGEHA